MLAYSRPVVTSRERSRGRDGGAASRGERPEAWRGTFRSPGLVAAQPMATLTFPVVLLCPLLVGGGRLVVSEHDDQPSILRGPPEAH